MGTKIMQPSHFMIGKPGSHELLLAVPLANVEKNAPNLRGNVVLEGAAIGFPSSDQRKSMPRCSTSSPDSRALRSLLSPRRRN